jgi:polysaccharide deacetylase family protein (PEP-CTERM system associated)
LTRCALTVDVEEYFQVSNFARLIDRASWDAMPSRVEGATLRLLDAFEARGQRATFFVLGWVAERRPQLVREIARRGHEIACHGYGHELVYEIGPAAFRADLRRARAAIEDAAGRSPCGYRAPSYSVTRESLWALEILAEEGFGYDSSIFPIRHPRYGIPGFPRQPLRLRLPGGLSLREFPLTTLALGPLTLPLAGGAYLRFLPPALFRWGWRRLARSGAPAVLYLHPWEVDPAQPRQAASWRVRVNHYHNLHRTEGRLERLLEGFCFAPMGDVLDELARAGQLPDLALGEGPAAPLTAAASL